MATRRVIDWESIGREFRAGQLSVCEIARKFAVTPAGIYKKMNQLGVTRDLSTHVANKFRSQIVSIVNKESEEEAVEISVNRAVATVQTHVETLKRQLALVDRLTTKLERDIDNGSVPDGTRASTLVSLAVATRNIIDKQRQALNLDTMLAPRPVEETILSILDVVNGQGKALPSEDTND